ncbi:MAG: SH3 domain-containing protein [Candidatus Thorarchaeota archaeon]
MKSKQCIVIKDYNSPYTKPLKLQKGERVQIGQKESEWQGWIWCKNTIGQERWVPGNYLDIKGGVGIMLLDYEATELEVSIGEELIMEVEESGWGWMKNKQGRKGWVPLENIKFK